MPTFLMKAQFSSDGIKGVRNQGGTARRKAVERAVESLGGELESFHFALGEYDTYTIMDLPDSESAAALSLAVSASGAVTTRIVTLLTPEEIDDAAARSVEYEAPAFEQAPTV